MAHYEIVMQFSRLLMYQPKEPSHTVHSGLVDNGTGNEAYHAIFEWSLSWHRFSSIKIIETQQHQPLCLGEREESSGK